MKKEQLTRKKIYYATVKHTVYFYIALIFAVAIAIPVCLVWGGNESHLLRLVIVLLPIILLGVMSCLTYFIDILTMNIKTIEEGKEGSKVLRVISHGGKERVGVKIRVNSENEGAKKLVWYNKFNKYSCETGGSNPRYNYKIRYHYLALSKVVVFTEYIPISENNKYNPKKRS